MPLHIKDADTQRPAHMMVIDTSALVAILSDEPERRVFNERSLLAIPLRSS